MRAADEVSFVYAADGASVLAGSAARAFIVIYSCEVVYDLYCPGGADLLAFAAGDASVCAIFADVCALLMAITLDDDSRRVLYYMDNAVRAFLCAKAAAYALS